MTTNPSYRQWNPGLDNDHLTLDEVKATLPANPPEDISRIVRLFENPDSPLALPGAVTLERHDCIHILLGRGLLNQDEAFVIGYTMGTAEDITVLEEYLFKTVAMVLYPKQYRFTRKHMRAYNLGLALGKKSPVARIYEFPFERFHDMALGELRRRLGIDKERLRAAFRKEQELLPDTAASRRLPVSPPDSGAQKNENRKG